MEIKIQRSEERGYTQDEWLDSKHSFSFGNYYNPKKISFGPLLVLNDDIIKPEGGFDMHPHENMEIVTIVLNGKLKHEDDMGNEFILNENEVQVMSAGTGIYHSEYNPSNKQEVNLLQIWILPNKKNIRPKYEQRFFNLKDRINKLQTIASGGSEGLFINQNVSLSLINLDKDINFGYGLKQNKGLYVFIIKGEVNVENTLLKERDAAEIIKTSKVNIKPTSNSELLLIEVSL